ncbi:hypothetical protein V2J09_001115 [Rumex salicifolius]
MKHIFKKLHKSHNDPNRNNETLIPATATSSTAQLQESSSSDNAQPPAVTSPPPPTSAPAPATETVAVPASPGIGGGGLGINRGGDFFSSEEEFQMQLALAISASNSESRNDPENDQIRAATLLSLGRSNSMDRLRDKEVPGEAVSRRYWDYSALDYEEKVVDGFYDVYAINMDPISQGKMPSLVDLETNPGDSGFEAIIVNRTIDPMLLELEQVAHCIAIDCPPSNVKVFVQRLAELVIDHMGGPVKDANIMLVRWMDRSKELRTSLNTSVFPIGSLKLGIIRHRALLFKVLADSVGLRCKLVKGSLYTGVEDVAVNMIKLDDAREFLVDLMTDPGTLIAVDGLSAKDSLSPSNIQLTNNSEVAYPRPEQMVRNSPGTLMGSAENHLELGTHRDGTLSSSVNNETGAGPSRISIKSTSPNQINFPSTSAVGASLYKANRGALTVGDGLRMNVNVVPYNQNKVDESKNLFADLNPFQIRGAGRVVQNKSQEDKVVESQRQRNDTVSGKPPLPMMWKNHQAINEAPRKKNQDFVNGLLSRNNYNANDYDISSSASSGSLSENTYHNTSKGTKDTFVPCINTNSGNSEHISPVAAPNRRETSMLPLIDSRNNIPDDGSQRSEGTLLTDASPGENGQQNGINGVQDHSKWTQDKLMKIDMLPHHRASLSYAIDPSAGSADPVLDDVGECEIPWEDLIIGERIGIGSYGEVYHADWNGTEVAVKKFLDQDFSGAALAEFKREVRIMRRLRHPNVVLFMGAVTRPPHLSIISEYLPRGSLYRIIHRPNCQIDEKSRLKMALDVARGMNCLHTSTPTIVHRDLKSPNLLVDKNWNVKVCDFGLSRLKHNTFLSSKSTAGTPEWMAPEVLRNEPSNEKCDVYSFGIILWELATLKLPWSGMNPMQVVGAVGFQKQRLEIPKEVDPLVARIILECWQTDPNLRPSFAQLCVALKPLQHLIIHSSSDGHQSSHMLHEISVNSTP